MPEAVTSSREQDALTRELHAEIQFKHKLFIFHNTKLRR
jgi:hypothetical protein